MVSRLDIMVFDREDFTSYKSPQKPPYKYISDRYAINFLKSTRVIFSWAFKLEIESLVSFSKTLDREILSLHFEDALSSKLKKKNVSRMLMRFIIIPFSRRLEIESELWLLSFVISSELKTAKFSFYNVSKIIFEQKLFILS